jgi:hypothetical protein
MLAGSQEATNAAIYIQLHPKTEKPSAQFSLQVGKLNLSMERRKWQSLRELWICPAPNDVILHL